MSGIMLERSCIIKENLRGFREKMRYAPPHPYPFLRPPVPPKPRRLPGRKTVTIAAGFVCNEGIVIAADSQETIPGYTKDLSKAKVKTVLCHVGDIVQGPILTCIYVGSGHSDYIATALEEAQKAVNNCKDLFQAHKALDVCLRRFHKERIAPWAGFPDYQQPSVELLIGISIGMAFGLFHYSGTSFHRCMDHKAIGTGAILANSLISQYCSHTDSLEQTIILASYIIHKVKMNVEGCGGFTQIGSLRSGGDFAIVERIKEFETEIGSLEEKSVKDFKSTMFASSNAPKVTWLMDFAERKGKA